MGRLDSKVAIITGGASGLGKHAVSMMLAEGAKVVIADLNDDLGRKVCDELSRQFQDKVHFVKLDVTDERMWQQTIDETISKFDQIDILVNSAGISISKNIEAMSLEDLRKSLAINVEGPYLGMKAVIEVMKSHGGSIINIGSMAGVVGLSQAMPYSTSKGALRLMTKSVAVYCAKQGYNIRVNTVNPAYIRTPMLEGVYNDEQIEGLKTLIPLGKLGTMADVSQAIVYLSSDESSFITGVDINIDGGVNAGK
ncbi:glucose 1-dehydrogenase [Macrococcus bovicus]|uniref:Diacetyl reductase [(S)-acetoin forming] n=1 Tax=Macrococcus bovicus TaxID=69968 RepID=A0A4R6C1P6_9STAP|nr:glucose 1-dehydrogenase [Macrococcus bovicus]TDM14926.1 glucose 1-dehydrogenase [Macrococcus bovicus]